MNNNMSPEDLNKLRKGLAIATLSELTYSADIKDGEVTSHMVYDHRTGANIYKALIFLGLEGRFETEHHFGHETDEDRAKLVKKPEEDFIVRGNPRKFETGFGHISNDMHVYGDDSLTVTLTSAGAFKLAKMGVKSPVLEAFLPEQKKQQPESFVDSVSSGTKIHVKEL